MKKVFLVLSIPVLACAFVGVVHAQSEAGVAELPALASHFETWQVESRTPLGDGDRHRIVYSSDADTAVVWTNLRGEPRVVRARIGGEWYARTLTAGTFPLSDSLIQAYRWMQDETFRRRLEALLDDDAVTLRNQ